ncbi:FeoB-associated Cys-rich membrane protein [Lutimonas halocynthiae]|nr:FeoB-associated Cys-rich membrane protein [Lutimonas halocynthiae]MDN3642631.1 FeoB-associated Cys-rich membrane protein [Lutimonas halocynthiae]
MVQEILVYAAVILALLFLFKKYIFKTKKKGGDCDSDCNC